MPIPTFENVMLPMLELLEDGTVKQFSEIVPAIADRFEMMTNTYVVKRIDIDYFEDVSTV